MQEIDLINKVHYTIIDHFPNIAMFDVKSTVLLKEL